MGIDEQRISKASDPLKMLLGNNKYMQNTFPSKPTMLLRCPSILFAEVLVTGGGTGTYFGAVRHMFAS